jgi:hypothetical protein
MCGHAHHTVTVRKLGLCTRYGTAPIACLSTLLAEVAEIYIVLARLQPGKDSIEAVKVFVKTDAPLNRGYDDEADTLDLSFGEPKAATAAESGHIHRRDT